jgi:hypothetical protein
LSNETNPTGIVVHRDEMVFHLSCLSLKLAGKYNREFR